MGKMYVVSAATPGGAEGLPTGGCGSLRARCRKGPRPGPAWFLWLGVALAVLLPAALAQGAPAAPGVIVQPDMTLTGVTTNSGGHHIAVGQMITATVTGPFPTPPAPTYKWSFSADGHPITGYHADGTSATAPTPFTEPTGGGTGPFILRTRSAALR